MRGNRSFFINESLALRRGLKLTSATDPVLLKHRILALFGRTSPEVEWLLRELRKERLG
jgi:hypothetical protein